MTYLKKPDWLKIKITVPTDGKNIEKYLKEHNIETVCVAAKCPNRNRCFAKGTATFMILGSKCTRNCGFCAVAHGKPDEVDQEEPYRILDVVDKFDIKHVVITSVTRDDLPDQGSGQFIKVLNVLYENISRISTEVLVPDFQGREELIESVVNAKPTVFNHNVETVPGLYKKVRPQAIYERSLRVLEIAKSFDSDVVIKSGFMVGLGETMKEIQSVLADLVSVGVDIVTVGQYLQPSKHNLRVERYITPEEFAEIKKMGEGLGIKFMHVGPFIRSSFNAEDVLKRKEIGYEY